MDSHNLVFKETSIILIGELIFIPLMALGFFLAGHFDRTVVFGGIAGGFLAVANFFLMALSTSVAADKAVHQDVKGGQSTMQTSYILRQVLLFVALVLCAKSGVMNLLALVIPVLFVRPIITIAELFRKKGGK